jgi:hypothetical protein
MHLNQLERCELITLLGGTAVAWPLARAAVVYAGDWVSLFGLALAEVRHWRRFWKLASSSYQHGALLAEGADHLVN